MTQKRRWVAGVLPVVGMVASTLAAAIAMAAEPADKIFINGKVFTADARSSVAQAFAIRGDRFVAVGSNREVERVKGPKTAVVDLKGRFVSPGLADNHLHSEGGGSGIDLSHARSMADLLTIVANAAHAAPADAVITSNAGWHEAQLKEQRLPTFADLDQASPDKPVVLARGGHSLILNSAALRKFNITKATPVPAGGQITKDANGELTGELFDAAKALVPLPPPPPLSPQDILATQKAVNPYGITAVKIPGAYIKGDTIAAYHMMRDAAAAGQLTLRYTVYLPGFGLQSAAQVREAVQKWGVRQDEGDDWVRIGGVKLGVDGGFEGGHLFEPYAEPYGKGGTYHGLTTTPLPAYTAVVRELNRLGWRATTHAVGDAAVEEVLDGYEAASADSPIQSKRWSIEHAFLSTPAQIARAKKLNLIMSVQDHLYLVAPVLKKYWGEPRASQVTPVKSYLDAGLLVTGGTDSPVISFNPFWELYHFMTRDTMTDGVYGPNQKVPSRADLLRLVTINYAKSVGEEKELGSIEAGKLADFAVLTEDFLTVAPEKVPNMKALVTYVGGREAWRDPAF